MQPDPRLPLVAALITACAAFVGAVLAQVLSHWFTLRREEAKRLLEAYEKLFAPIIFDSFLYLDASTHYRAGHDVVPGSPERLLARIVSHVGEQLTLASPRLIGAYYRVKRSEYIQDDESGYADEVAHTTFLSAFVDEFYHLVAHLRIFDREQRREVARYRDLYRIWKIASQLHRSDESDLLLRHSWLLSPERIGWRLRRRLQWWDRRSQEYGEGWQDLARQFDAFVVNSLARDDEAKRIIEDAFVQVARPRHPSV